MRWLPRRLRLALVAAAVALVLVSCGDEGVLSGLGDRSHEFVEGSTTTTVATAGPATTEPAAAGVVSVEEVGWFNESIEGETIGDPNYVVSAVWARGRDGGRFIQASPAEVAVALPGIEFPAVVPDETEWITSQLVYDAASATLDLEISAAFGMWAVEPYTESEGRLAVLRVGQDPDGGIGGGVTSSGVEDGLSLGWSDGSFRYELFCRTQIPEEQCWQMVESARPLDQIAPQAAVEAG